MTILERLYASSGSEVIHDTLQISAGDDNYWLTSGWDDVSVMLEMVSRRRLKPAR